MGVARPVLGHEFWLEPAEFQPENGATLQVSVRNGQRFSGGKLGYFDDRIVTFDWIQNGVRLPVDSRAGDFPALTMTPADEGLMVLVYQATDRTLIYNEWEKFVAFAEHKDFPDIAARHIARGLPQRGFGEVYSRYCKSLVGVGVGAGQDTPTGLLTEFVALNNPYTDDLAQGFAVRLLYQDKPQKDAQVEVFERAPNGKVEISLTRTDDAGRAQISVKAGHTYLLDAVILREPSVDLTTERNVVWETLWASMTFAVPG